jgi:hypothetical protein
MSALVSSNPGGCQPLFPLFYCLCLVLQDSNSDCFCTLQSLMNPTCAILRKPSQTTHNLIQILGKNVSYITLPLEPSLANSDALVYGPTKAMNFPHCSKLKSNKENHHSQFNTFAQNMVFLSKGPDCTSCSLKGKIECGLG